MSRNPNKSNEEDDDDCFYDSLDRIASSNSCSCSTSAFNSDSEPNPVLSRSRPGSGSEIGDISRSVSSKQLMRQDQGESSVIVRSKSDGAGGHDAGYGRNHGKILAQEW